MAIDKKTFLKLVTICVDTREKEWGHIESAFDELNVKHETRKLDYGDYSFVVNDRDFSMSCVIERKASVDELYNNMMQDRERISKEFDIGSRLAKQVVLLIEGLPSLEKLKDYTVPDWQMKTAPQRVKRDIGAFCYTTLLSWQTGNRYNFRTVVSPHKKDTAAKILEEFYYYWRNYSELVAARKFT
jgi:ERCC4-type nuclease